MLLESFAPDGRVNMKMLASELPQNARLFDPDRDLTGDDWTSLKNNLDLERILKRFDRFAYLASAMKILGRLQDVADEDWAGMQQELRLYKTGTDPCSGQSLAVAMALLRGRSSVDFAEEIESMKIKFRWKRSENQSGEMLDLAHDLLILDGEAPAMDAAQWKTFQGMSPTDITPSPRNDYFLYHVSKMRMLGRSLPCGAREWDTIRSAVRANRKRDIQNFAYTAARAAIAAADGVALTPTGIEVTKHKQSSLHPAYPCPQVRHFVSTHI